MATFYSCDGCGTRVELPVKVGFVLKREYCPTCAEIADRFVKEEEKGIGYKVRLFLGLAKKAEEVEIKQLSESNDKLKNSIETLAKLIDEVPSDVAKVILKEQVENLKQQQADIEVLIETKTKKAKGLFG